MSGYPTVALGSLLHRSDERMSPVPDTSYKEITVKLWGKGVILRRLVDGSEIVGQKRFVARTGQAILSRIDARNGAIGIVPPELDGGLVTNDFPLFNVDGKRLDPVYFNWLSKTQNFVDLCIAASEGTTNRVRLQESRFMDLEIPLPPLAEQRRIVARIEQVAAKVAQARALREEADNGANALFSSRLSQVFTRLGEEHSSPSFHESDPFVTSGPRNWSENYSTTGMRFYRAQDITAAGELAAGSGTVYVNMPPGNQGRSAILAPNDLLIVITGATVGRVGLFTDGAEPGLVSQHVAILRLPSNVYLPEYVWWGLKSPMGQHQLLGNTYGQGKPGLNLTNIRDIRLPRPSIEQQRNVIQALRAFAKEYTKLVDMQRRARTGIDAMIPALLSQAFGE